MLRSNGSPKANRTKSKKSTDSSLSKKKLSTKAKKQNRLQRKSTSFRKTSPALGVWDTPQDAPGSKPEPYVDFFKDTPVNGLAQQLVRDLRDFVLIQTGSPQYFDREYEQQKLLGKEEYANYRKQMADNNYGAFQGYNELDFQTSYYKRVGMVPANNFGEVPFRRDPNHSLFRSTPQHLLKFHNVHVPAYIEHREHTARATGVVSAGPYWVPKAKFQYPLMSIDNDYLFFHD